MGIGGTGQLGIGNIPLLRDLPKESDGAKRDIKRTGEHHFYPLS